MKEVVLEYIDGVITLLQHNDADVIVLRGAAKEQFIQALIGNFDPNPEVEAKALAKARAAMEIRATKENLKTGHGNMGHAIGRRFDYITRGRN